MIGVIWKLILGGLWRPLLAVLDPSTQSWITLGLLVAAGLGRMIDQGTAQ